MRRILDWFHIAMRFEHVHQRNRGMRHFEPDKAVTLMKKIESAKWRLSHGQAEGCIERLHEVLPETSDKLQARLTELIKYLQIDYGARYRSGLPVASRLAESAVNFVIGERFKKKGQMRWTQKGANALLHIRVADLNGELADRVKKRSQAQPCANQKSVAMGP